MLVTAFAASIVTVQTVQATPSFPWGTIDLHAVVTSDPFWGYYGGYHDILKAMKAELANIGINLIIRTYDQYTWWDITWDSGYNIPGGVQVPGMPPGIEGWDMFTSEWWLMPSGMLWLEEIVYNEWTIPEGGFNVFPWMNAKADDLLKQAMWTLDAETRETYIGKWQEMFMADPPMINMYYSKVYEVESLWLDTYDPTAWFMEVSHMTFNETTYENFGSPGNREGTLLFGLGFEEVWSYNNLFMMTYTDDRMCDLKDETLYDISVDMSEPIGEEPWDWPPSGVPPNPWNFFSKPALASDQPEFITPTRARVPLRRDVYWSDGCPFNATDVRFTIETILDEATGAEARADLMLFVDHVEYVYNASYTCPYKNENYDPWLIDFILHEPGYYSDVACLLSNEWGCAMIPWHTLKDIPRADLSGHASNIYPDDCITYLPALGPFKLHSVDVGPIIELRRNDNYFGYDLGWGPYNVSKMILKSYPDPFDRLAAIQAHEIDFAEYSTASKETFEALKAGSPGNGLRVWQYDYPASHPLWLNLDGPKMSNRYFRMALAHAIPYEHIYDVILPSWGVEPYAGKSLILPQHYYTEPNTTAVEDPDLNGTRVRLFNEELDAYEFNITKATEYMNMWWYSQQNKPLADSPVGDADFSGLVELPDYYIWTDNIGTSPPWTFLPGCDIDPDFDNSGLVDATDYLTYWRPRFGYYYPEGSTTHQWSIYIK